MAIDERDRHDLYQRLEQVLGDAAADTMMALLPPVGWADVATKEHVDTKVDGLGNALRAEIAHSQRQLVLTLVPVMVAINGVAVAITGVIAALVT